MNSLVQPNRVHKPHIPGPGPVSLSFGPWQNGLGFSRFNLALAAIFLLSICMPSPLSFAQTANTGAVTGTITDPSGALVTNAAVKVTNEAAGDVRTVISGERGNFSVPLLSPGSYSVEA